MNLMTYLTTSAAAFGPLAWAFFSLQIAAMAGGIYLALLRGDPHPIRGLALRRFGYALLVTGAFGTIVGALRLAAIAPFTARYWFYLAALFELLIAAYALFYALVRYPARKAELARPSRARDSRRGAAQPALRANGNGRNAPPTFNPSRQVGTTGRREARRDRKRRSR